MKSDRCGCKVCVCPNPTFRPGWLQCRPCAIGWHNPKPCANPTPDNLWPVTSDCALCGYALTKDGKEHAK